MKPIADSLDYLQGDKNCHIVLYYYILTLSYTKEKLNMLINKQQTYSAKAKSCQSLVMLWTACYSEVFQWQLNMFVAQYAGQTMHDEIERIRSSMRRKPRAGAAVQHLPSTDLKVILTN